jgi:hypothetical protein
VSRYARRVDTTHADIRDALRDIGAVVHDTSALGDDFPDLVVGWRGRTLLVECKTPTRKDGGVKPSAISVGQRTARVLWQGDAWIVATSPEQAIAECVRAVTSPP